MNDWNTQMYDSPSNPEAGNAGPGGFAPPVNLQVASELEVSGNILPDTIPLLVHTLHRKRKTGILRVREADREKCLYLRDGRILFATSTDPSDRLGQVLLQEGMVAFSDVVRETERAIRAKKRLGTVLMEREILAPNVLVEAVRCQVTQIVNDVFQWNQGTCEFFAGELPSEEITTLTKETDEMILEAMRSIQDWNRILDAVGGLEQRFVVVPELQQVAADLNLGLEEWHLLSFFEEPRPLEEVCKECPLLDLDICRTVWAFLVLELLVKGSTEEAAPAA